MPATRPIAGRYELGPALGSGGFATVYRARDTLEDREVAVKVIPTALAAGAGIEPRAGEDDEVQFERFRQEALALSRLRSRFVVRVHDFGRDDDVGLFLVMELVEGVPLQAGALGRALLPHEVLRVARGLLAGLAEAHRNGIVHRDIKPSNVLIPHGPGGLDEPRILDFGVALDERRASILAQAVGHEENAGVVLGTRAYMAPEQLLAGTSTAASDVYAAGLVLFELLGEGALFAGATLDDQLGARLTSDASIAERIAPPLGSLLGRMLERDPERRFQHAGEALDAIGDLETAPVSIGAFLGGEDGAPADPVEHTPYPPTPRTSLASPPSSPRVSSPRPPPEGFFPSPVPMSGVGPALKRLSRLTRDPVLALIASLHALDLAMIDALARRERGSTTSRIARAVALALRLELDAAALILEPLTSQSDLARAFGATLVAPRARRATRARVDPDRSDAWLDTIDLELAGMLSVLGTVMTVREEAARNEARCRRSLERANAAGGESEASPIQTTVRMAQAVAATFAGATPASAAMAELLRLRDADRDPPSPFLGLMRAILLGLVGFRADEHVAREQLEWAQRTAAETGNTLLEMRAIVAWGGMLVEIPERVEEGLGALERATTLLAHGDAPSLEHVAEHNRGAALVIQGRYSEAAPHLRRARIAAKGELSLEHEILSCMNEGLSHVSLGDRESCARIVAELSDARLAQCSPRTAAYCHIVRSMHAMLFETPDRAHAELRRAHARAAEADAEGTDAYLLGEALGILYAAARHEDIDLLARAGELQKLAQDHGMVSFYWFEVLRAMVTHVRDDELRRTLGDTLERLIVLLGPPQMLRSASSERASPPERGVPARS